MMFGGKTRNVWLPTEEKKCEDRITRFDRIHERDTRTDRRTPHDGIGRACIASCGKNVKIYYKVGLHGNRTCSYICTVTVEQLFVVFMHNDISDLYGARAVVCDS